MSVNIEELAAHLDRQRQKDVKEQYNERATNATAAFLLCFFLGFLGAHRFYLGQWRSGLAHLALSALGVAGVIAGFLTQAPLNAALFIIGGILILASLIWEIIDLGRIDAEIHRRNTLLAEGLIAGALLSDSTAIEDTMRKLDETVHTAAAQSRAAGVTPVSATAGMISLEDLAQARALAEESGRATISYQELSNFTVSATPEERAGATQTAEPTTIVERRVNTEPLPGSPEAAAVIEAQTHTHSEESHRVTDAEETDRVSGPAAAVALGLGGAALGAGVVEAASAQEETTSKPASAAVTEPAEALAPEPAEAHAPEPSLIEASPTLPSEDITAPAAPAEPEISASPVAPRLGGDVTDAGAPTFIAPASDVAFASSYPGYIELPEEPAPIPVEPIFASESYTEPYAEIGAADAVTEPDVPLYVTPEEPAPTYTPPAEPEPPAESYVPPVPDVYSAATPQPETYTPSWEAVTSPATPMPQPAAPANMPDTLAELAGAGAAGAVGSADALAAPAPEPLAPAEPAEPATPKMKRIRVKHRIVVEGQVVREEIVEREVPADMDMAVAAREIQAELEQSTAATPDEIARLANLSSEDEVEVRRRVEGLGQ